MTIQNYDFGNRDAITASCRLIKRHASFVGVAASEVRGMPPDFEPLCMDELNEAIGVMQRAIDRLEGAKERLQAKPKISVSA